ncbi:MAG: 50S ribosomal protein L20 [Anaerolineae bacterium]|jgi:large subunit ribosomal protein L20|nr:50S ribosomal protein L20 [Chloroflexota bacterium]
MPRVKRGVTQSNRRKKVLNQTKGQVGSRSRLLRKANEALLKSLAYQTRDRKNRKRDMRRLWIQRINAGARANGVSYSRLINGLRAAQVDINRKMLADLAAQDPAGFAKLVEVAQQALSA